MKKIYPRSIPHHDLVVQHLKDDPEFAALYLKGAIEEATDEEGQKILLTVLKRISEARGMQKVAKKAGIPRQSLYRILSEKGNPRMDTFLAVIRALGLEMTFRPVS